jgi:hypothetical protein
MKPTIAEQRERLTTEETRLRRKWDRLNEQAAKDQRRVDTIQAELRRLDFLELVGKPGAVKIRYRFPNGDRCAHLNDKPGTVLAVRRTRATVDFGDAGRWNWCLGDLLPLDKPQGEVLNLGDGTP